MQTYLPSVIEYTDIINQHAIKSIDTDNYYDMRKNSIQQNEIDWYK